MKPLPCPWCGKPPSIWEDSIERDRNVTMWWVACNARGCADPGFTCETRAKAIQLWNRRHPMTTRDKAAGDAVRFDLARDVSPICAWKYLDVFPEPLDPETEEARQRIYAAGWRAAVECERKRISLAANGASFNTGAPDGPGVVLTHDLNNIIAGRVHDGD